jgi:excisionase family DNA binding protein
VELLTTRQAAERLGLSPRSISTMAASGKLAAYRLGTNSGTVRFSREDLDAYSALKAKEGRLSEVRGRIPQPWFRASTKTWYVWMEGRQIPLGKVEQQARKTFRRLMTSKKRNRPVRPRPRSDRTDKVYFIQDTETEAVKIGVSIDPKMRFNQLQTGYPYRLVLLGTIPGSRQQEVEMHVRFERFHIRGEWFRGDDQLLSEIRALIEGINADDQASR